jgi:hypothetical protein
VEKRARGPWHLERGGTARGGRLRRHLRRGVGACAATLGCEALSNLTFFHGATAVGRLKAPAPSCRV